MCAGVEIQTGKSLRLRRRDRLLDQLPSEPVLSVEVFDDRFPEQAFDQRAPRVFRRERGKHLPGRLEVAGRDRRRDLCRGDVRDAKTVVRVEYLYRPWCITRSDEQSSLDGDDARRRVRRGRRLAFDSASTQQRETVLGLTLREREKCGFDGVQPQQDVASVAPDAMVRLVQAHRGAIELVAFTAELGEREVRVRAGHATLEPRLPGDVQRPNREVLRTTRARRAGLRARRAIPRPRRSAPGSALGLARRPRQSASCAAAVSPR